MKRIPFLLVAVVALAGVVAAATARRSERAAGGRHDGERVKEIATYDLKEKFDGKDASVTIVEVTIAPGQAGLPHHHPGPVFVYAIEGEYELGIDDQPTKIYKAGESFQEPSGCVHRVSRNPAAEGTTRLARRASLTRSSAPRSSSSSSAASPRRAPTARWFGCRRRCNNAEARLARALAELDRERKAVGEIQRSLVPASLPEIPGLEMSSYYRPSEQAGGDYYDVVPLVDDQWGFVMADVAGHGTPAAVIMTVMRTLIHTELPSNRDKSAGEFLEHLNGVIAPA